MRGYRRMVRSCIAASVVWTGVALAAGDAKAPTPLEEVTVTATRVSEPAFNIPASIDRIGGAAFNDDSLGISLSSGLATIPGVVVRDRQNYAQDTQISIRGFGARSAFGIRGIRLYVDGIPATQPDGQGQVSHFNLAAAERVEVLRGPFSVLYGNSAGGVVQLFTADGAEPTRLFGGVTAGSYGSYRTHLGAGGTVGDSNYRFDYTHFGTDGYRDHSSAQRGAINGKLGFKIGERGQLTLLVNGLYAPDADDPLGLTRAQFDADPRQVAGPATQFNTRKSVDQTQGGAIYDHDLGNGQALRLLAYYGQRSVEQYLSIPAAPQANPTHSGGVVDLGADYHGVDLRWSWRVASLQRPLTLIAGLSYDDLTQHRRGYENFIGSELGVRGALRRDEVNDIDSLDPYLQANWQFAERWSLLAGLRYNRVRFSSDDRYVVPGNGDDSGGHEYSASTPVLGVMFHQNPSLHWYASWGRGFETPTFAELAYPPIAGSGGLNYDLSAARNDSFELGTKLRLGTHTRAQVALFRIDAENELVVASNVGGRATYRNADNTRRRGIELSSAHTLAPRWHLDVSWTWIDTELSPGKQVPGVPKSSLYSALRWGGEQGWFAALDGEHLSRVPVNDANSEYAPSYALAGMTGGYVFVLPSGRVRTFLRIDNVLDKQYVGSVIVNDGNGRFYEPGPERSFLAGVSFDWAP